MRILITTDYFAPHVGGGVEVVVEETAKRFAARGHEVLVLTLATAGGPPVEDRDGYRVVRHRAFQLTRLVGLQLTLAPTFHREMTRQIRQFRPHVVNPHNLFFTTTLGAATTARRLGIPVVTTLHLGEVTAMPGWKGQAALMYERAVGRRVLRNSDHLVAVSQAVANHARQLDTRLPPITVVPNGVDLDRYRPAPSPADCSTVVGLFVGRLLPNKGPRELLQALLHVPDELPLRIDLVGDGPMRSSLERFVDEHGLANRVRFLGLRQDVPELMRASDFFVRPSTLEGMPLTVLEAMASGLPVVATPVAGTAEIVVDEESGILVPPGHITALARAITRLARDTSLRRTMGTNGRRRIEAGFSWEATSQKTLEVLYAVYERTLR